MAVVGVETDAVLYLSRSRFRRRLSTGSWKEEDVVGGGRPGEVEQRDVDSLTGQCAQVPRRVRTAASGLGGDETCENAT